MYKISILISVSDYGNNLKKSLNSLKDQTLKDIEILLISPDNLNINNKIKVYNSFHQAINETESEYVLFIDETDFLQKNTCELLYNKAKNENLDSIYIPIIDANMSETNFPHFDKTSQFISQFYFGYFCKKNLLNNLDSDKYLFYEIYKNSKKTYFLNQKIYFRRYISRENVEYYTKEFLSIFPNEPNIIFSILIEYLINYPLNLKQSFYNTIKVYFKNKDLNKKNKEIYNLILNSNYLIDFLTEHKLNSLNYEIYENSSVKNNNFKISVIIPIYNNEKLIHRTLMSVENQSIGIENIEVIMINDASTDNTKNILNNYVDKFPNFKAIHIKNGTGSSGTPRNLGLKLASAKYIIFLDHDDFFEINALEKLYEKITNYNCDIVYGTYILNNFKEMIKFTYPNETHGFFKKLEENKRSITTPPSIWTKLFKKEFLEKNNILFPTILGEDAIFMSKALKYANGIYYMWNDIICYYNLNENSYSTNLSYKYFMEGFASEEYLFNLFNDWKQIEYYKIRGPGILDFYINRMTYNNLTNEEIMSLFPIFYKFCYRLYELNVKPTSEKNNIIFNYVINNDSNSFLKFKNYKPTKFKILSNKILNKINKHGHW